MYQLIQEIDQNQWIGSACTEVLEKVKERQQCSLAISVAEVGVGVGATSVQICKRLRGGDSYTCFDFSETVEKLVHDLQLLPDVSCKIASYGNTHKHWDSYAWALSNLLFAMRNRQEDGMYDVVYLDGAHSFFQDGLACCLLKELVKPGGYLIFDDMKWTYASSPTVNPVKNPATAENMTEEQIEDPQVTRVVRCFMEHDPSFVCRSEEHASRAVFQKKKSGEK